MSDYRSVTHTIVELLARKKIKAVPRDTDKKRTELRNVARPDDDRKGDVPTRQGEIIRKVIDETWADELDKKAGKFKKGDRVLHVGGWPGMVAGPQSKWKAPKGTITGTHTHKGELIHSIKVDGNDHEHWGHPRDFKKIHEQAGLQSVATEPAKGPGPDKTKKSKKLEIQDVGHQPPTKVEINPELDNTPNILSSKEEKGKLIEAGNQYNNVSIQYQTRGGIWVTARKTSNDPADIMLAMRNVQKVYSQNRVRAIGARGMVLDFQPIDPSNIATEEKKIYTDTSVADLKTDRPWFGQTGGKAAHNPKLRAYKNRKDMEKWEAGRYNEKLKTLRKEETKPKEKFVENPKGKIDKQNTGWKSRMAWIKTPKKEAKKAEEKWEKTLHKKHYKEETQFNEGLSAAGIGKSITSTGVTSALSSALSSVKKAYPKAAAAIDKVQSGYSDVTKFMPGYSAFAGQRDMLSPKIVTDYIAKNKAKKEAEAQTESTQVSPGVLTIERTLRKILEARHSGIETDEPKFNQSIQKVAAHAKTYTDVAHTYKHKDGSKTRVDQKLGEKIHDTIHSTPHRHRADLIQKMHSSADNLKHALKEGKTYKVTKRSGEAKALENPVFRKRVVKDKTAYTRKEKHKGKENDKV